MIVVDSCIDVRRSELFEGSKTKKMERGNVCERERARARQRILSMSPQAMTALPNIGGGGGGRGGRVGGNNRKDE